MRRILGNGWTAAALGLASVALHLWWFLVSDHQGEVLSGFGGATTVLGVIVAGQPYIWKGVAETAREQVGLHPAHESPSVAHLGEKETENVGIRHVLQERVFGVLLISCGSLLNGYGPAIATALNLRGS